MSAQTIERMAKWVENNVAGNPTLNNMSSYVGYSPFYCSAKFREHMGMTYKQFLSQCRLRAALMIFLIQMTKLLILPSAMDIHHLNH